MDANVRVWKTETCELISEAKLDLNEFWKLKFSADNNFLITGSPCGKIFLYDVLTFVKAKVLDTRGKFTLSVAIVSFRLILKRFFVLFFFFSKLTHFSNLESEQ